MKRNNLYFLLSFRTIAFILIVFFISLITKKDVKDISKYWTLVVIGCNIITIIILSLFCKKSRIKYSKLIDFKKSNLKEILIIGFLIVLLGIIGVYFSGFIFYRTIPYTPDVMLQQLPLYLVVFDLILLPITSTISEEGLYLGLGINYLNERKLTLLFYLLQHCFFPMILDIKYILYRFISFIPVIMFMIIYYNKKKQIIPIMFGHFFINFVTILQYFLI